ncbi:MAG: hypothetical protein AAF467_17680 [Actinomycetota bacterium]
MQFDRANATLLATPADIEAIASHVAADGATIPEAWIEGGLGDVETGLDPTATGIAEVVSKPDRSVVIERFDGDLVTLLFVAWDRTGRATISQGASEELLAVTATDLRLLPALLAQALRLRPGTEAPAEAPRHTTVSAIEQILGNGQPAGNGASAGNPNTNGAHTGDELDAAVGEVRHAWRATGSWSGREADRSVTLLSATGGGLWEVSVEAPDSGPVEPTTPVVLRPVGFDTAMVAVGDVVTGRTAA